MENGGVFLVGILVFFFLLWAFTGGPSRPISFSGPYITPITNEGETQAGYGPQVKVGGTVSLPGATVTATERTQTAATTPADTSSYSGLLTLSHVVGTTANPTGFIQISVSSSAGKDIDITGWSLTSSDARESGSVPTGILVMQLGTTNTLQEIILRPGDKAVVAPGASPAVSSFEANECSGYLTSDESKYNPCVAGHVSDPGFLLGTWYVYLGRTTALWESSGDVVSLLDGSGNVVASTSY